MSKKGLTPKQLRFIEEYLIDLNATQAAIRAGYSKKTARQMGTENLSKPAIQSALQKAMDARSERTAITQDYVLHTIQDTVDKCGKKKGFNPNAVLKGCELLGRHLKLFSNDINLNADGVTFILNYGGKGAD